MSNITIHNLIKSYPPINNYSGEILVLNNISIVINSGEFITVFGPNGCGKSTLLKVLSGIEPYDSGEVLIDNKTPKQAKTGLIFQDFSESLMPWLNCKQNILFPFTLKERKNDYVKAEQELKHLLKDLNIEIPLTSFPYQISGGQQKLIAIIRTLLYKPDVILLDEPFSSLDFQNRLLMQHVLLDIWYKNKITIIFVSHDIEEAIFLANRLVILSSLPASIAEIKIIPFEYPRNQELLEDESFFGFKKDCLKKFKEQIA